MELSSLPLFSTPFIGRQDELAQIAQLLNNPACRLLTLLGPGGIGKTRLATEVARLQQSQFADGVYAVALQPITSTEFIIPAIAAALRLQFYPGGEPQQQLLDYLGEKQVLLLLDNFEHLLDAADVVSAILAHAPQVKVLATSRERLNVVEEWVLDVEGLSTPNNGEGEIATYDAVQLFLQNAQRVQVGFTLSEAQKPAVARICQLVDGMPLGIELAAAWVRALSCEEIAAEIERSMDILATPVRNVPQRHRNMRAALEHSWNLLPPTEQNVFQRLSVFRGGFTREAAEAVAGASIWTLTSLVDKSLLRGDANGRYHLQELLRQYAEEQLAHSGEAETTRDAHSAYYANFMHMRWAMLKSRQQRRALDDIDANVENIRAAWQHMCRRQNAAGLAQAARSLWLANDLRCRFPEMVTLFGQAVEALTPISGTPEIDRVLGLLIAFQGWSHVGIGLPKQGKQLVQQGLAILQPIGNEEEVFMAYFCLQLTTHYLYIRGESRQISRQVVQAARATGDPWALARALYHHANFILGYAERRKVKPEKRRAICAASKRMGDECLRLVDQCGDTWLRASISGFLLGNIHRILGNYTEAMQHYEQSLPMFREVGQTWAIGAIYRIVGETAYNMRDYDAALRQNLLSLRVFHENGQIHEQVAVVSYLARIFVARGEDERALQLLPIVIRHSENFDFMGRRAERLLEKLMKRTPPEAVQAAVHKASTTKLDDVIAELLAEGNDDQPSPVQQQPLEDPLTERELEILHLMASGMTNREIADRLVLSPGTIKWYSSQIFSKLEVKNRVQALARAGELTLLTQPNS